MKRTFSGLAMVAAGLAMMAAAPDTAQAGSVVDELRSRGLGTWVDRYVEEDSNGKVSYKSSKSNTTATAPAKAPAKKTLKAKAPKKKALKTTAKKKSTKARSLKSASKKKASKKKVATRKLSKKKIAKKNSTNRVASNTKKKKYKVPSSVKDRLASYGINF